MSDFLVNRKKFKNGDKITGVDVFVSGFKPIAERDQYLQDAANKRKAQEEEEERLRRAAKKNSEG